MILSWLTRNMTEAGICLTANVKKDCTWIVSFDYFDLYGTENGVFVRDRVQREKANEIPLPLTLADLKPLLIAYHEILDAHRWDDMIEWTPEERIENIFKDALKKHAKRTEQEKKSRMGRRRSRFDAFSSDRRSSSIETEIARNESLRLG